MPTSRAYDTRYAIPPNMLTHDSHGLHAVIINMDLRVHGQIPKRAALPPHSALGQTCEAKRALRRGLLVGTSGSSTRVRRVRPRVRLLKERCTTRGP